MVRTGPVAATVFYALGAVLAFTAAMVCNYLFPQSPYDPADAAPALLALGVFGLAALWCFGVAALIGALDRTSRG